MAKHEGEPQRDELEAAGLSLLCDDLGLLTDEARLIIGEWRPAFAWPPEPSDYHTPTELARGHLFIWLLSQDQPDAQPAFLTTAHQAAETFLERLARKRLGCDLVTLHESARRNGCADFSNATVIEMAMAEWLPRVRADLVQICSGVRGARLLQSSARDRISSLGDHFVFWLAGSPPSTRHGECLEAVRRAAISTIASPAKSASRRAMREYDPSGRNGEVKKLGVELSDLMQEVMGDLLAHARRGLDQQEASFDAFLSPLDAFIVGTQGVQAARRLMKRTERFEATLLPTDSTPEDESEGAHTDIASIEASDDRVAAAEGDDGDGAQGGQYFDLGSASAHGGPPDSLLVEIDEDVLCDRSSWDDGYISRFERNAVFQACLPFRPWNGMDAPPVAKSGAALRQASGGPPSDVASLSIFSTELFGEDIAAARDRYLAVTARFVLWDRIVRLETSGRTAVRDEVERSLNRGWLCADQAREVERFLASTEQRREWLDDESLPLRNGHAVRRTYGLTTGMQIALFNFVVSLVVDNDRLLDAVDMLRTEDTHDAALWLARNSAAFGRSDALQAVLRTILESRDAPFGYLKPHVAREGRCGRVAERSVVPLLQLESGVLRLVQDASLLTHRAQAPSVRPALDELVSDEYEGRPRLLEDRLQTMHTQLRARSLPGPGRPSREVLAGRQALALTYENETVAIPMNSPLSVDAATHYFRRKSNRVLQIRAAVSAEPSEPHHPRAFRLIYSVSPAINHENDARIRAALEYTLNPRHRAPARPVPDGIGLVRLLAILNLEGPREGDTYGA